MSYKLVIAEKPSVAQSIAKVIGADKREDGYLEGNGYLVSWCVGHPFADQVKRNNFCTFIVTAFFKQMDIIHDFLNSFFIQVSEWIDRVFSNKFRIYIINIQYFTNSEQLSGTGLCDAGFPGTDGILFYMDIVIFKFFCKLALVQSVLFSMFCYGLSQIIHNRLPF